MDFPARTQSFEPELSVTETQNVEFAKEKLSRHKWTKSEDILLLKQYRCEIGDHSGTVDALWAKIHGKLVEIDSLSSVSLRGMREHGKKLIKEYAAHNRLDEWKSGDPGKFDERESLLCDILEFEADQKTLPSTHKPTSKEMEKQARKDQKFQFAAKHSLKKRKLPDTGTNSSDNDDGPKDPIDEEIDRRAGEMEDFCNPPRERTSYNQMVKQFLGNANSQKDKEIELEKKREERLASEQAQKMKLREAKLEIEKKREENREKELNLQSTNAQLFAQLINTLAKSSGS